MTIPLPAGRAAPPAAAPTGMIWNPTSGFPITVGPTTVPATFIFDTEDGTIAAWNPAVDPITAGRSTATDPFWRGSLPTTAKGISEILGQYDCMLGLGGKTLVAIVYTARDPIPEDITFYHISEDGNAAERGVPLGRDAVRLWWAPTLRWTAREKRLSLPKQASPALMRRFARCSERHARYERKRKQTAQQHRRSLPRQRPHVADLIWEAFCQAGRVKRRPQPSSWPPLR